MLGTVVVDTDGNFTVPLSSAQLNGQVLSVTQTDSVGHISPVAAVTADDIITPTAPGNLSVADTGLTLSGTGEAGTTVTVKTAGGATIGTGTVAANGSFTVTLNPAQTTGATLSVTLTDGVGHVSQPGTVLGAINVIATNDLIELDFTSVAGNVTNTVHAPVVSTSLAGASLLGSINLSVLTSTNALMIDVADGSSKTVVLHGSTTGVAVAQTLALYVYELVGTQWVLNTGLSQANYIYTGLVGLSGTGANVTLNLDSGQYAVVLGRTGGIGVLPTNTITETSDISHLPVTTASTSIGNVLANDSSSVVGTVPAGTLVTTVNGTAVSSTGTTIAGLHGNLVIKSDGSYTYTLTPGVAASSVTGVEHFTYAITTPHNGTSTATLNITLHDGVSATSFSLLSTDTDSLDADSLVTASALQTTSASLTGEIHSVDTAIHTGTDAADQLSSTADNDTFTLGGGADTVVFHLLDAEDATGGNGVDTITDFTVGQDHIDVSELLEGWDGSADTIGNFVSVEHKDGNTVVSIDRDGTDGTQFSSTELVTLENATVTLEELLQQQNNTVS
ncbi:type I secretion C-terminal target domain-containing protein [Erwinia sp. E602]|nr:type I secretion C-terminal target domain-containing protein [Erwinia sp. E602]